MVLLARKIRGALWAQALEGEPWKDGNFPYAVLTDLHEREGGVSFFEVKSKTDPILKRVAAALTFGTGKLSSADFRFVKLDGAFHKLGVNVVSTPGRTKDLIVNGIHRELCDMTGKQAVQIAKRMSRHCAIFSEREVARFVASALTKQQLPLADVQKELLKELAKYGAVRIRVPNKSG